MKICLDIGHGQDNRTTGVFDPGAVGSGRREYDEAKLTAENVMPHLSAHDHELMVIDGGRLTDRQTRAARWGAQLYVSFHLNAGGGTGTESYVRANPQPLAVRLQEAVHPRLVTAIGLRDRGQKRRDFAVITGAVPAVLLELCFIDNASDMAALTTRRADVSKAIADGILDIAGRKASVMERTFKVIGIHTTMSGATGRDLEFESKLRQLCAEYGKQVREARVSRPLPANYNDWFRVQ